MNLNQPFSYGLSLYRVVLSFIVLKNVIFYFPIADQLFGNNAIVSVGAYMATMYYFGIDFLILPWTAPFFPQLFLIITAVAACLFMLGIGKRITGIALFLLVFSLNQRNGFILDGSDNVIAVTLPFLIFTDCFKYFTYSRKRLEEGDVFSSNSFGSVVQKFSLLALIIQISYVYFFTALHKLQGELWLNGTAVYYTMRLDEFRATSLNIPLTENHYFVVISTYFTLLWELSFAFLIWFNRTKIPVLIGGVLLHIGIWIFMRIDNFSTIMIASYLFFLSNKEYKLISEFFKESFITKMYLNVIKPKIKTVSNLSIKLK